MIIRLDTVASTNDAAKEYIKRGAAHGTAVVANRQSEGRGQHGRAWQSSEGGLFMSIIVDAHELPVAAEGITIYAGEAVKGELERIAGLCGLRIKPPNDIYYGDRKLCGILTELTTAGEQTRGVIGIGINVNNSFFGDVADIAISLKGITGREFDILELAKGVLNSVIGN